MHEDVSVSHCLHDFACCHGKDGQKWEESISCMDTSTDKGDYESEREIDTHPLRWSNTFSEIVRCVLLNHLYDTYEKQ